MAKETRLKQIEITDAGVMFVELELRRFEDDGTLDGEPSRTRAQIALEQPVDEAVANINAHLVDTCRFPELPSDVVAKIAQYAALIDHKPEAIAERDRAQEA